jgi:hypothetical protein
MPSTRLPLAGLLIVTACAPAAVAESLSDDLHGTFAPVLADTVQDGRVDYAKVASSHAAALDRYLGDLAAVDLEGAGDADKLAYYINLYNATMLKAVVDGGGRGAFKPSDKDFDVFKRPLVRTKAGAMSLNDLENKVVRPTFEDARVHAALVCAAVSCPPLIDRPYTAAMLDAQLDANVKSWLADPSRNRIDDTTKTLRLSKIFDWYADDFGGKANVAKWVAEKTGRDVGGYKVEFVEYDWTLNSK